MGVRVSSYGQVLTAFIAGDIDHHTSKDIRETIDNYVEKYQPKVLELDFSGVQFMDSSGIGLIMGRFKLMSALKGKLQVVNIPKGLERMVKLSGLMVLGIFKDEEKLQNVSGGNRGMCEREIKQRDRLHRGIIDREVIQREKRDTQRDEFKLF